MLGARNASGTEKSSWPSDERRTEHDEELYGDSKAFAKAMQKDETHLSEAEATGLLEAPGDRHQRLRTLSAAYRSASSL